MSIQIEDGRGTGNRAKVDSEGSVSTRAIVLPFIEHVSEVEGKSYSWSSGTYDYSAADTILLIKNTGDIELHIKDIWLSGDTDTRVIIHLPTAEVTPTGTTITGVNLNTGSSNVAEAAAARDETNNSQGNIVWSGEFNTANGPTLVSLDGAIILAKNKSIGVDYVTDGAVCDVTMTGYYE